MSDPMLRDEPLFSPKRVFNSVRLHYYMKGRTNKDYSLLFHFLWYRRPMWRKRYRAKDKTRISTER